jgi:hypothetical protein
MSTIMTKWKFLIVLACITTCAAVRTMAEEPVVLRKAAIFVENRGGKDLNEKVSVFEDLLTSKVAGMGFSILSRDIVTRALREYPASGNKTASDVPANALDSLLETNTSALRLAQNLGVDFILYPTITTFGHEKRSYSGNGIATENAVYTLRVTYRLAEAAEGGAFKGATVTATKSVRQSEGLKIEDSDIVNGLLDDAAGQLAKVISENCRSLPKVEQAAEVEFSVTCNLVDEKELPVTVPYIEIASNNAVVLKTNAPIAVQALDVTVELDGVAIGSAPGSFKAKPGLHKIRLSREGCSNWDRTINVTAGQKLRVAIQMSREGYARWKDNLAFLHGLENNRKLTDAEVKRIEGIAKFFSESHYRVDTSENIKIYKSLY